ncbi:MAG: hypothetical protein ACYDGR_13910 [Candidatus Dormibacteria bacterium]
MRVAMTGSEAKGRNGYFRVDHADVDTDRFSGELGQVRVDVFSKRVPANAAPCRLFIAPSEAEALARAILEVARLVRLECRCCGARSDDQPGTDGRCGNCADSGHTCCICGATDHRPPGCPQRLALAS